MTNTALPERIVTPPLIEVIAKISNNYTQELHISNLKLNLLFWMQDRAELLKEGSAYERTSKSILGPALTPNTSGICI